MASAFTIRIPHVETGNCKRETVRRHMKTVEFPNGAATARPVVMKVLKLLASLRHRLLGQSDTISFDGSISRTVPSSRKSQTN